MKRKAVGIITGLLLCLSATIIFAAAAKAAESSLDEPAPELRLVGDADGDGIITILDATEIQRYLADLPVNDPEAVVRNGRIVEESLSILDATAIQRYLADFDDPYPVGEFESIGEREPHTDVPMPDTVTDLSITTSSDRVYLTWDASANASGYDIYYDKGDGRELYATTTGHEYRGKGLSSATEYAFYVYSYCNDGGNKIVNPTPAEIRDKTLPSIPSFKAALTKDTCAVTWSEVAGAHKYEILTKLPDETDWTVDTVVQGLSYSFPRPDAEYLYIGVVAVTIYEGREYRSEYRIQAYPAPATNTTMASFGDSICRGLGANYYSFAEMLARSHGLKLKNCAVNSATLSYTATTHSICDDVINNINEGCGYSYIIVEGGINDYYYNAPLGEVAPEGAEDFDTSTVCGALETIFTRIRAYAPNAKLIYVLVHDVNNTAAKKNSVNLTFTDYAAGILQVCAKYGVPAADCGASLSTSDIEASRQYTWTRSGIYPDGDGLHPNKLGYELFYVPVIEPVLFG